MFTFLWKENISILEKTEITVLMNLARPPIPEQSRKNSKKLYLKLMDFSEVVLIMYSVSLPKGFLKDIKIVIPTSISTLKSRRVSQYLAVRYGLIWRNRDWIKPTRRLTKYGRARLKRYQLKVTLILIILIQVLGVVLEE